MDLNFLSSAIVPVVVGICLCIGYIIKYCIPQVSNNYIPLILASLGLVINIWVAGAITPTVVLGGLFSGLSATGLYETFRNFITKENQD